MTLDHLIEALQKAKELLALHQKVQPVLVTNVTEIKINTLSDRVYLNIEADEE